MVFVYSAQTVSLQTGALAGLRTYSRDRPRPRQRVDLYRDVS